MRTEQGEVRHRIMVKARHFPVTAIVAFCAVSPIAPLVAIILGMAAKAITRRVFDAIVRSVTLGAGHSGVLAEQRKAGVLIMIEACRLPACRRVATGAIRASRSLMSVILGVAADAGL